MLEPKEKAKYKITISSNIVYFKLYCDFRGSELHCDPSARYVSHLKREPGKKEEVVSVHTSDGEEDGVPIAWSSSENRIKSAFEKVSLIHLRKFTLCKNKRAKTGHQSSLKLLKILLRYYRWSETKTYPVNFFHYKI